jgi:hypothetical protein
MILGPYLQFADNTPIPENTVFAQETCLVLENMCVGDYPELGRMFPKVVQLLFQRCLFPPGVEFWSLFPECIQKVEFNYCRGTIRVPVKFSQLTSVGVKGDTDISFAPNCQFPLMGHVILHHYTSALWEHFILNRGLHTLELSGVLPDPNRVLWTSLRSLYLFDLDAPFDLTHARCPRLVTVNLNNCTLTGRGEIGAWLEGCPRLRQASFTYVEAILSDWVNFAPSGTLRNLRELRIDQCRCAGSLGQLWWKFPRLTQLELVWSTFRADSPTPELGVLDHLRRFKWLGGDVVPDVRFAFGPALEQLDLGPNLRRSCTRGIVRLLGQDRLMLLKLHVAPDNHRTDDATEHELAQAVGRNTSLRALMYKEARQGQKWLAALRNSPQIQAVSFRKNYFTRPALLGLLQLLTRRPNYLSKFNLSTAREIRMPDVTPILRRTHCVTNLSLRRWMFGRRAFLRLRDFVQQCNIIHIHVGAGTVYGRIRSNTHRIQQRYAHAVAEHLPLAVAREVLAYC